MIRIYNGKILTMEHGMKPFDGEVWTEGSRIVYAGEKVSDLCLSGYQWERSIDAEGGLIMPGFKNAHTHSAMTFLRSHADDLPLLQWLNRQVFPWEAKLTPEDIYHLSRLAVMEYLTSGITANFDMYLTPDTIAQASEDCGFRTVLCGALNDFSQSAEQMEEWYQTYNKQGSLISFQLGFHAEYTTSKENLLSVAALSQKYKAPVYTHSSEGMPEVLSCRERTGMTPTAYMDSLGLFDYGGGCFHCVHMEPEDLKILKRRNLFVITNPASNLKLASGIAPIKQMMDMEIGLAIGTDGPASNNCLDMFREMFLVTGLSKYRENDASVTDADEVLKMATLGGAAAMGLSDCDTLREGKQADLILIDLNQPNMRPLHNLTKNLVYSGSKQNVRLTMVAGKILYEDGEFFIGEEPENIYDKAEQIAERIFES
ncbi:amidohydrolase [Anaerostipes sp.]|uniref:amidohydrolase n=1 Tax=Anaerostipes sp. TaxID=1872530 RepID=UPI0025C33613|nr:amidohydrolase [Anaerostipes sp.]MBS7007334.1 amidohydrolase [Anaerostipes sp.]